MFRVIDNKKVEMTQDEARLYDKIVHSYTTLTNKGEDLFMDLFEVDDNGIIIFLKPPCKRQTSFEVFLFLMSLQRSRHIRLMYARVEDIRRQMQNKMDEINKEKKKK